MRSTPVTFRRVTVAIAASVAAFAAISSPANAAVTLTLSDTVGDPTQTVGAPGTSFTVNVTLTSDQPFTGLTFFLSAPGAGSSRFSITGRTASGSNPLSDATSTNAQVLAPASALLDPRNNSDLGYSAADFSTNIPAGTYSIGTLTLTSVPSLPLVATPYIIGVTDAVLSDASFNEFPVAGGTYAVYAPEPTTLAAVASLGTLALVRRRRAR